MRGKPRAKPTHSARPNSSPPMLTIYVPLVFSLVAIGVSAWAVVESREAALQSRRAEVSDQIRDLVNYGQETYARTVCILSVAKGQEAAATQLAKRYEKTARGLDEIRATSDIIQRLDRDRLNQFEERVENSYSVFRRMSDTSNDFKKRLTPEELERFDRVCQ